MFKREMFVLFALVSFASANAAELANNCKLKGGSLVRLDAGACTMEGGAVVAEAVVAVQTDASLHLADDPKLASAQRAVAVLLGKTVEEAESKRRVPEGVERVVKFDGCRLMTEETLRVDRGNLISARMNFKISASIDLRNINRDVFDVAGKVSSIGGGLKAYGVFFQERKRSEGNNLSIAMLEQREEGLRKASLRNSAAYWDAPRADLWMVDEYGYPQADSMGNVATDKVSILFLLATPEDAAALKSALNDLHAVCKR